MDEHEVKDCIADFPHGWVAFWDDNEFEEGEIDWFFVPKAFWEKHKHMPDVDCEPEVEGFYPIMEWTWQTNMSIKEATEYLESIGCEVLEDPEWYWEYQTDY